MLSRIARQISVSGRSAGVSSRAALSTATEWFPTVNKIGFDPETADPFTFKHYDADKVIQIGDQSKSMREWLRFSVCFWHTFRGTGLDPFGAPTISRSWDPPAGSPETLGSALRRMDAAFEFFGKLGVDFFTFHDVDVCPQSDDLAATNADFDVVADGLRDRMDATGMRLLWSTCNLFSHPRYMNGAGTNPDFAVFARALAQVKKGLEVNQRLGGENWVFWGGREGFQSILNTDVRQELDHAARFLGLARDYRNHLHDGGAGPQLLIEPKPHEPSKHQYDYDAQTVIGFLRTYGLEDDFKLNIEPNHTTLAGHSYEHDVVMASQAGMLGSIDANTGDPQLGWDTDQFPMDPKNAFLVMDAVVRGGGLATGGLNFDAKVRRESTDDEDLFLAHIGAMDTFAFGLKMVAKSHAEGTLEAMRQSRYVGWDDALALRVLQGSAPIEQLMEEVEAFAADPANAPRKKSGRQEAFEMQVNRLMF